MVTVYHHGPYFCLPGLGVVQLRAERQRPIEADVREPEEVGRLRFFWRREGRPQVDETRRIKNHIFDDFVCL